MKSLYWTEKFNFLTLWLWGEQNKNKNNTDVPQVSRKQSSKKQTWEWWNDIPPPGCMKMISWRVERWRNTVWGCMGRAQLKDKNNHQWRENYLSPACWVTTCSSDTYLRFSSGSGSSWRGLPSHRWWIPIPADLRHCGHLELHHLVVIDTNRVGN